MSAVGDAVEDEPAVAPTAETLPVPTAAAPAAAEEQVEDAVPATPTPAFTPPPEPADDYIPTGTSPFAPHKHSLP